MEEMKRFQETKFEEVKMAIRDLKNTQHAQFMLNNEGNYSKFGLIKESLSKFEHSLKALEMKAARNEMQGGATPIEEVVVE